MESKEKETNHFDLMYGLSPTHAHDKKYAYMGWGATPKSRVGFV